MNTNRSVTTAIVPTMVSADVDFAEMINEVSHRVLSVIDDLDDAQEIDDLRVQWQAFMKLVATRRRRSNARAEKTARLIELRLGEILMTLSGDAIPDCISPREVHDLRLMCRFRSVVADVVRDSTNERPATRNQVITAIRWHRIQIGELKPTRSTRAPRHVRDTTYALMAQALNRTEPGGDGDLSVVYQRVRQALAQLQRVDPHIDVGTHQRLSQALIDAERFVVELIRSDRATR